MSSVQSGQRARRRDGAGSARRNAQRTRRQRPPQPAGQRRERAKLFVDRACWQCHGLAAQGGGIAGPRLAGRVASMGRVLALRAPADRRDDPLHRQGAARPELADIFAWLTSLPPPPDVDSLRVLSPER